MSAFMNLMAICDAAQSKPEPADDREIERFIVESWDVIDVMKDLQRHGADFIWYEHPGDGKPGLLNATSTGLLYGIGHVEGQGWIWNGEKRELLESWHDRIAAYFEQAIDLAGTQMPPGSYIHYPKPTN